MLPISLLCGKITSVLLNSVPINSHQQSTNISAIKNGNFDNIHEFVCDPGAIELLSFKLPLNRACSNDNIFAEHIRYAHESTGS